MKSFKSYFAEILFQGRLTYFFTRANMVFLYHRSPVKDPVEVWELTEMFLWPSWKKLVKSLKGLSTTKEIPCLGDSCRPDILLNFALIELFFHKLNEEYGNTTFLGFSLEDSTTPSFIRLLIRQKQLIVPLVVYYGFCKSHNTVQSLIFRKEHTILHIESALLNFQYILLGMLHRINPSVQIPEFILSNIKIPDVIINWMNEQEKFKPSTISHDMN